MDIRCHPLRKPRTSLSLYRRWPPGVRIDDSLPPRAHRVTVLGSTRSMAATSAGVSKRFSGLILALTNSVLSYVGVVGQLRKVAKHGRNFPRAFYHRMSCPPGLCRRSDWLGEKFPVPARLVL